MLYKYSLLACLLCGLVSEEAQAGCFGRRVSQCQSAPVLCTPCTPTVCAPVASPPMVSSQATVLKCVPLMESAPRHAGPAFRGVSPLAPLGVDDQGDVVTSVGELRSQVASADPSSSERIDLQRFLQDLLTDRLAPAQANVDPPKKQAVLNGPVDQATLNRILAPYKTN